MILNPECLKLLPFRRPARLDKAVIIALMSAGLRKDVSWAFGIENNTVPSQITAHLGVATCFFVSPLLTFPFPSITEKLWSFAVNYLGLLMIFIIWEAFKMLHFIPGSLLSCAPMSLPQKKMLSSPLLSFKGSVILQLLEQFSFIHFANYPIMKSLHSDNTVFLVYLLYNTNQYQGFFGHKTSLVSCLLPELMYNGISVCRLHSSVLAVACFHMPVIVQRSYKRNESLFMDVTKD